VKYHVMVGSSDAAGYVVVDLPPVRRVLLNAVRLVTETMIVPTTLLYVMLRASGLVAGLATAVAWHHLCVAARWLRSRRGPGDLALTPSAITIGTCLALATSAAVLAYLVEPILGSCCMAALFLGSALVRRPLTVRLAMALVHLPAHTFGHPEVSRVLHRIALLWGLSRLLDAVINYSLLQAGANTGLLARNVLTPTLTTTSLLLCAAWGWRSLRANGVELRPATASR
jgi:hypothetical protein